VIHGDYSAFVSDSGVDAVTQYELWKAVWSSLNDGNFHELDWALQRHNTFQDTFAPLTFVGNHDVTRIASKLERTEHLAQALVLLLTIGGVPSVYAGDELGYRGVKEDRAGGDDAVRPEFSTPPAEPDGPAGDVLNLYRYLIGLRRRHPWLHEARTASLQVTNRNYVYETRRGDNVLIVALNVDDEPMSVPVAALTGRQAEVVAGSGAPPPEILGEATVGPHGWMILTPR